AEPYRTTALSFGPSASFRALTSCSLVMIEPCVYQPPLAPPPPELPPPKPPQSLPPPVKPPPDQPELPAELPQSHVLTVGPVQSQPPGPPCQGPRRFPLPACQPIQPSARPSGMCTTGAHGKATAKPTTNGIAMSSKLNGTRQ